MPQTPSLNAFVQAKLIRELEDAYFCLPGVVLAYYPEDMTVDVQVATKVPKRREDASITHFDIPPLSRVPLMMPYGSGFYVSMPMAAGDTVALVFSTVDSGRFETTGEVGLEPYNCIRNGLSNVIAQPGWRHAKQPPDPADATDRATKLIIGREGGTQIRIGPDEIDLGGGATESATSAKQVYNALAELFDAWTPVANDGGAALKAKWTAAKATLQAHMSATVTKVK